MNGRMIYRNQYIEAYDSGEVKALVGGSRRVAYLINEATNTAFMLKTEHCKPGQVQICSDFAAFIQAIPVGQLTDETDHPTGRFLMNRKGFHPAN